MTLETGIEHSHVVCYIQLCNEIRNPAFPSATPSVSVLNLLRGAQYRHLICQVEAHVSKLPEGHNSAGGSKSDESRLHDGIRTGAFVGSETS